MFLWSSTGKKFLMALSGLALVGFVVGHLVGNLQMFLGPEAINRYAAFLKGTGELLWVVRLGLLALVGLHIATAISLTLENRKSRPIEYDRKRYVFASYASRTMMMSGLILVAFIVYHLLHFTLLVTHPEYAGLRDPMGRPDVFSMVVLGFQNGWIAAWYGLGVFLLGMHLSHGFSSAFQSLGAIPPSLRHPLATAGRIAGWAIFAGYASIPLAVQVGIIHLPSWVAGR